VSSQKDPESEAHDDGYGDAQGDHYEDIHVYEYDSDRGSSSSRRRTENLSNNPGSEDDHDETVQIHRSFRATASPSGSRANSQHVENERDDSHNNTSESVRSKLFSI